jgi:hypothetical protein
MRPKVYLGRAFRKWALSEAIAEQRLCTAAWEAAAGQVEADLGGSLFKKRIARRGAGKSGGYRTIICLRRVAPDRVFFLYGFPKSSRPNITRREKQALAANARALIAANAAQVDALIARGALFELECET